MHHFTTFVQNIETRRKQSSIAYFAFFTNNGLIWLNIVTPPQLACDITKTRGTGIVTSYLSIVLAFANGRKVELHSWMTTVNIVSCHQVSTA